MMNETAVIDAQPGAPVEENWVQYTIPADTPEGTEILPDDPQPALDSQGNLVEPAEPEEKFEVVAVGVDLNASADAILNSCVGFRVTKSSFGITKKVDVKRIKADANDDMLSLNKRIISCKEYNDIKKVHAKLDKYLRTNFVPSYLEKGTSLVKRSRVQELNEEVEKFAKLEQEKVAIFVDGPYQAAIEFARSEDGLNELFDQADYPPAEEVRQQFGIKFRTVTLNADPLLKLISPQLYEAEVAKIKAITKVAAQKVASQIRGEAVKVLDHLIERLSPSADGEKKTFKNASIKNIREFMDLLSGGRDVIDDDKLAAKLKSIGSVLDGADPEEIRSDEAARNVIKDKLQTIRNEMDELVVTRPTRKFRTLKFVTEEE